MDQLKKVLKYQFWILLGVAIILPLVGWVMARSGLVAEAASRQDKLKGLMGQLTAGPEDPNGDWEKGLGAINSVQVTEVRAAWETMYDRQKPLMTWPKNFTSAADPSKATLTDQEVFRTTYSRELTEVWKVVRPIELDPMTGVTSFPDPQAGLPNSASDWETQPPTPAQIIAAQEDLWLLKALLTAIDEVNKDATSQIDAPVKLLQICELKGGSTGGAARPAASSSGAMSSAGMTGMSAQFMDGMSGARNRGAAGEGGKSASATFSPADEFGPEVDAPGAGGAKSNSPMSSSSMSSSGSSAAMMVGSAAPKGGTDGTRRGGATKGRYIEDKKEWRTRGFYLELVMDHRRVPELLVTLSNSPWPIRITRVQQVDYADEDLVDAPGSSGLAGGTEMRPGISGPPGISSMMPRPGSSTASSLGPSRPLLSRPPGAISTEGESADGRGLSAFDDPMLANVAVSGVFTIFKKPDEPPQQATPQSGPGTPTATPPAAGAQTAGTASPAATEGADAAEKPTADETPSATESDKGKTAAEGEGKPDKAEKPPATEAAKPGEGDKPADPDKPAAPEKKDE